MREGRTARWAGPAPVRGRVVLVILAVLAGTAGAGTASRPEESDTTRWAREAVSAPHTAAEAPVAPEAPGLLRRGSWHPPEHELPDFAAYRDVPTKKERFFAYLLPLVEAENDRIRAVRRRLGYIYDHVRWHHDLRPDDVAWLLRVAEEYGVDDLEPDETDFWSDLLQRVDTVPRELVLVQAANESAWGTSRFAQEGNNLFGQWCFREGCGIVPANRPAGATYEVARYATVNESVGSYMHNLNTGRSYQLFREIRARMRADGRTPSAGALAAGLSGYSERGEAYVDELRAMIRHNAELIADLKGGAGNDRNEAS